MTDHPGFVYMDDNSIDDEFKCSICNEPFEKPMCTPCDHTFCRSCIEQWLPKSTGENGSCPTCRQLLSTDKELKAASRIITNRIDRYLVKCLGCELDKIPRGSFFRSCFKGPRSQLDDHLKSCSYQQIRPALEMIQTKNIHLQQLLIDQQQQITSINERCQTQQNQINELTNMIKSTKGTLIIRMAAEIYCCHSFIKLNNEYVWLLIADHSDVSIKRIITFEDLIERNVNLNSFHSLPSTYAGFTWRNGAFMPRRHAQRSFPNTGFATAFTKNDQQCVVFNFGCRPITMSNNLNTFHILSFEATCAFQDEVILAVTGRRAEQTVQTGSFILRWQELKTFTLNWNNINELEFLPLGGKQLSTSTDTDRHVVLTRLNLLENNCLFLNSYSLIVLIN